jgi:L-malate glycosyltransferase
MRICLLSLAYPPISTEGIARQRHALATELARCGHDIHVITCGVANATRHEHDVQVHEVLVRDIHHYSYKYPNLDVPLTQSQALYERLNYLSKEKPFEIVDVPLWAAQGFVTLQRYRGPTILWLQTTRAQLLKINGNPLTPGELALAALERSCLERAGSWLADSHTALESILGKYGVRPNGPTGVAHLGLPVHPPSIAKQNNQTTTEALVVGRLEKRKGIPLLFEALPGVLHHHPQFKVRLIGRDNSADDGWYKTHHLSYSEYFQRHYPDLANRVIFEGYVDEARLNQCYQQADFVVVPSLYESFGLVYLEAMRAGLPIITFATGAAKEIFADGEADGALVVPLADSAQLAAAISNFIQLEPARRRRLGQFSLTRFQTTFSAEAMAAATLEFYRQATSLSSLSKPSASTRTVYQVMEALDVGDAVSNITRRNAALLSELGQPATILTRFAHPRVKAETSPLQRALSTPDCGLIFHYWNYNSSTWLLSAVHGPKAVHYHNITPPQYFPKGSAAFKNSLCGYTQLAQIADRFDLIIGDSRYNIHELAKYLKQPKPAITLYPVVEIADSQTAPYDTHLFETLRQSGRINIVFVGRIVRNKRQDQLLRLFDYYYSNINRHAQLWLVGSDQGDPLYRTELEQLRGSLKSKDNISFTGKVSDTEVNAYYRAADVFVSASEHEGFCIPIAQAMTFAVPVLAYAAAAVPETMGEAGILIHRWDVQLVAELMHLVLNDFRIRQQIIAGQNKNLERFSGAAARESLKAILNFLLFSETSLHFEQILPGNHVDHSIISNIHD